MPNDSNVSSIRAGRRAERFVQTPEWILVAGLTPQAQALYTALLAHVNRKQGDGIAWPGMAVLAEMMGYRKRQSISPYLTELATLGAIQIIKVPCQSGQRNEYVVHEIPPPGYLGFKNLAEYHANRRERTREQRMSARADIAASAVQDLATSAVADMNKSEGSTGIEPDESASGSGHTPVGTSPAVSLPHRASSPGIVRLRIPAYFYDENRWDEKRVHRYLVGAVVAALTDAGMKMDDRAAGVIGRTLKYKFAGATRRRKVEIVRHALKHAGDPNHGDGWLASWPESKAS